MFVYMTCILTCTRAQAWSKKDKDLQAPNICAMIEQFNCVTSWVQQEILAIENITKRAAMLKKFIKIGEVYRRVSLSLK